MGELQLQGSTRSLWRVGHGGAPATAPSPTTIIETMVKAEVPVMAGAFRQNISQLPPQGAEQPGKDSETLNTTDPA